MNSLVNRVKIKKSEESPKSTKTKKKLVLSLEGVREGKKRRISTDGILVFELTEPSN